jgi:hypothetical protein
VSLISTTRQPPARVSCAIRGVTAP